jgi:hypothetical protein
VPARAHREGPVAAYAGGTLLGIAEVADGMANPRRTIPGTSVEAG